MEVASVTGAGWSVPLCDLAVDDVAVDAVARAVQSGWWSMGPRVSELEEAFAEFCGAGHAVAVSNGSAALHLALLACGVGPGDEVVLPSLNFVAAANAILHAGATPVFCDVRGAGDLNLDPSDVEAAVTERTAALLVLHYAGYPCDMDAVGELAQKRKIKVIEDAAHAPGATWRGAACGTLGDVGCFSFFSNKNLPVGEGGMVVTDDVEIARRLRLLRSHGMTTLTWDRHRGHASSYDVVEIGFNCRMDELHAALALVQLERLDDSNSARRRIVDLYRERLGAAAGVAMPFADPHPAGLPAHHLAVVVLDHSIDRTAVQAAMRAAGIQTSVHYPPIHQFSAYRERGVRRPLPRTEDVAERILTVPLYPHMSTAQAEAVCETLLGAVDELRAPVASARTV